MILFLLAGATIYGRLVAISRLPFELAEFLTSLAVPAFVIMGLILLIHLVLGMFIDAMAMILLTIPICLLYTSPSPRDGLLSRMPSSA